MEEKGSDPSHHPALLQKVQLPPYNEESYQNLRITAKGVQQVHLSLEIEDAGVQRIVKAH